MLQPENITDADLARFMAIADAASPEPWQWGHTGTKTVEDAIVFVTENVTSTYEATDIADLSCVFVGDPDVSGSTKLVTITGNGPTSRANAEYIAAAQPRNVQCLITEIRRQRNEIARLARLLEKARG